MTGMRVGVGVGRVAGRGEARARCSNFCVDVTGTHPGVSSVLNLVLASLQCSVRLSHSFSVCVIHERSVHVRMRYLELKLPYHSYKYDRYFKIDHSTWKFSCVQQLVD